MANSNVARGEKCRTPAGVMSYAHLFKARAATVGAEPRFSVNLIFDKAAQATPEYAALKKSVLAAVAGKWGPAKAADKAFLNKLALPFRSVEEKEGTEGYDVPGGVFISAWTKQQPGVIGPAKQDLFEADVFSGQVARMSVTPFAWEHTGKRGVSLGLGNVQVQALKAQRIGGGRSRATDDFDVVEGAEAEDTDTDTDTSEAVF